MFRSLTCLWLFLTAATAVAETPLHVGIDALLEAQSDAPCSPCTDDASFVRRVYLDFAGRIPAANETAAFLADSDEHKRRQLVDSLLASDEFPRRLQQLLHVMFMERLGDHEDWQAFLLKAAQENKPWDQLVREILNPDPESPETRGAAFFYTKRLENYGQNPVDYPGLVRDVGRLFLGVDVQCAQCHDHLFVDEYKQVDFQGLFAFVGNTFIRRDVSFPAVGENPLTAELEFTSVFEQVPRQTGPRLPRGMSVAVPEFAKGEEYLTPPDKKNKTPGVLKFSTLKILAEQLPRAENELFTNNVVNRLWWTMMGRGLVEPLDLHHVDNPPSHPELLELLADEFVKHQFDIRWLLRELALTQTYQRGSAMPEGHAAASTIPDYRAAVERRLSAEQLARSVLTATGELDRLEPLTASFTAAFANTPRDPELEFVPSVKAALFVMNDDAFAECLEPREGNLTDQLIKTPDSGKVVDQALLAILSRPPTSEERDEFVEYIDGHADRAAAIQNVVWSLFASTEFCLNH